MRTHTFSLRMIKRFFRHYFGCLPQNAHYISSREYLTSKRFPNVLQWGGEKEKAFQSLEAMII